MKIGLIRQVRVGTIKTIGGTMHGEVGVMEVIFHSGASASVLADRIWLQSGQWNTYRGADNFQSTRQSNQVPHEQIKFWELYWSLYFLHSSCTSLNWRAERTRELKESISVLRSERPRFGHFVYS